MLMLGQKLSFISFPEFKIENILQHYIFCFAAFFFFFLDFYLESNWWFKKKPCNPELTNKGKLERSPCSDIIISAPVAGKILNTAS